MSKLEIKFLENFPYEGKGFKKGHVFKKGKKLNLLTISKTPQTAKLAAENLQRQGIVKIL